MTQSITVNIPMDSKGMLARLCPQSECQGYFKLKPGTGFAKSNTHCPYCGVGGESSSFTTKDQIEYAKSVALKQVAEPLLNEFKRNVEGLNSRSASSMIRLRFSVKLPSLPHYSYREKDVETAVVCDNCGLNFSVFGMFALCPGCAQTNALSVLIYNLKGCRKRLALLDQTDIAEDHEFSNSILQDALGAAVSAFDAFGKKLRELRPDVFPRRPQNQFQNFEALDKSLASATSRGIAQRIGHDGAGDLMRLLQVRHIYEHNLGVVDDQFVSKVPGCRGLLDHLYPLEQAEVRRLLMLIEDLSESLKEFFIDP